MPSYTYILMKYKEHSGRLTEWKREFAEAAHMCAAKVKGLPKGEKVRAYRACMRETLRKK